MVNYEGIALNKRTQWIVDVLGKHNTVLDIGCGTGSISQHLGAMGYEVTGVDLDDDTIKECKKNNAYNNVKYVLGDGEKLNLPHKYDALITAEVIEHTIHPKGMIDTVSKYLNDDGIWIATIPNGYCLWELLVSRFIQKTRFTSWLYNSPHLYTKLTGSTTPFYSRNQTCLHINFYSFWRFKRLVENNGFKIISINHTDLGILPEWNSLRILKNIECKLADYVPHFMAGGWMMVIKKGDRIE